MTDTDIVDKTAAQIDAEGVEKAIMERITRASFKAGVGIDAIAKEGAQSMNEQVQVLTNKVAHETLRRAFVAGYAACMSDELEDTFVDD